MRYFTYILLSLKNNDIYVGSTDDIKRRLHQHNDGRVRSTQPYRPWKLLEYHVYNSRGEAVIQERFLKSHQQKEFLKKKYGLVAKR